MGEIGHKNDSDVVGGFVQISRKAITQKYLCPRTGWQMKMVLDISMLWRVLSMSARCRMPTTKLRTDGMLGV